MAEAAKAINWNAAATNQAAAIAKEIGEKLAELEYLPLLSGQRDVIVGALITAAARSIQWAAEMVKQGEDITPAADTETWQPKRDTTAKCHFCPEPVGDSIYRCMGHAMCKRCAKRLLHNQQ